MLLAIILISYLCEACARVVLLAEGGSYAARCVHGFYTGKKRLQVKSYPSCKRFQVVCFSGRANEAVNVLRPLSPRNFLKGRGVRRTEKPNGFLLF